MAAIKRASWLLLIGLLAACKAQETEQKPPLPDVSLLDLYKNITEVAAIAASLKTCAPDDAICIALKDLLTPPPPAGPPAYAPGPSQRVCPLVNSTRGDGALFAPYCLPLTNITNPGVQNRDAVLISFPTTTNPGQFPDTVNGARENQTTGGNDLTSFATIGAVAPGNPGGWTLLTTDTGNTMIHATPLSNGQLLIMERPGNREPSPFIAAIYNLNTNNYRYFPMTDNPFCAGHIRLMDDSILIVGGDETGGPNIIDGRANVRRFVPGYRPYYNITDVMQPYFSPAIEPLGGGRWYPTLTTMVNGNVLIASGAVSDGGRVNPTYQTYLMATQRVTPQQYLPQLTAEYNLYPYMAVLPSGAIICISNITTRFYRYDTGTNLLSNDTTTYPAVPNLPAPILYPFTASVVMLPLEQPGYNPRILVVGGSPSNLSDPGTPATPATYLLDFSVRPFVWRREDMATGRVMPDTVLLPDGTVFICNGADTGIAGGGPGVGIAGNNPPYRTQAPEIYNTAAAVGSRLVGLLATSGRDRLYHSVAWLSNNAEVFVSGSEATSDYTMQLYTPPYLTGTFSRPILGAPSVVSPAYGARITVPVTWVGGAATTISRVVVNRQGGITHSYHFDARQVTCVFTSTGTVLTITMPPSAIIAPPGVYSIYAVTSGGRPSTGVDIGLGGAAPRAPLFEPVQTGIVPNGVYTIQSVGLGTCATGTLLAGGQTCAAGNGVGTGLAGTWTLTLLPNAPDNNTYTVVNSQRPTVPAGSTCWGTLSTPECQYGDGVDEFAYDDLSGRQRWNIQAAPGGGYYIRIIWGRVGCNTYLSANPCGNNAVYLAAGDLGAGLQSWRLTAAGTPTTPAPPPPPAGTFPFPNGQYLINNVGRNATAGCASLLSAAACSTGNGVFAGQTGYWNLTLLPTAPQPNTYSVISSDRAGVCYQYLSCQDCGGTFVDMFVYDDNSGRQQWTFTPVAGGYTITVVRGRETCGQALVADPCATSAAVYMNPGNTIGALATWQVTARANVPSQLFPNGQYNITSPARIARRCNGVLNAVSCATGNAVNLDGTNLGGWTFTYLPSAPNANTYQVVSTARNGVCNAYLSSTDCYADFIDLFNYDDASGRQQWVFTPTTGGYYIRVLRGRTGGCGTYFSAPAACAVGQGLTFATTPDTSGNQVWAVTQIR